tara:strand:- start:847 stop:1965 length:1119 start_codon:yes stop_codon:yes gene_type:complete
MNRVNLIKISSLSAIVALASCGTGNTDPCTVNAPADYSFTVDGLSTVTYSGQTQRLQMAGELGSALSDPATTEAALNAMFNHQSGDNNFAGPGLNASSKQIRNKTAYYSTTTVQAEIHEHFEEWFKDYADNVAPAITAGTIAASGTAGMAGNRELNAKGFEYDQFVAKSLIGAMCLDQIVNGYLADGKIGDAVDNVTRDPNEDMNSTAMEHHWDEGFGYVYGVDQDITTPEIDSDGHLGKYLNKFEDHRTTVYNAFKLGRQAIVDNCSEVRDAQAQIIKETLSLVVALKAEGYLRESAAADALSPEYFHALSEGYGFILSLQFTHNANGMPYFSHEQVHTMLATLEAGNGFWDRTPAELIQMADDIAAAIAN